MDWRQQRSPCGVRSKSLCEAAAGSESAATPPFSSTTLPRICQAVLLVTTRLACTGFNFSQVQQKQSIESLLMVGGQKQQHVVAQTWHHEPEHRHGRLRSFAVQRF